MNTRRIFVVVILSILLLSACGANAIPTEEAELESIYTAAASTLSAQEKLATPTPTATMFVIPKPFALSTTIPATVTTQNVIVSYSFASTANGCNDAAYVSDVTIADGTVLIPGELFTKTWEFQNTGTCVWNEDYLISFVSGTDMDGETTEIDQYVETGNAGDISVSLVAPSSEGSYTRYWRLADADGNLFGQSVYVMILVSEDAATLTPTATSTTEATATTEPTSTSTPLLSQQFIHNDVNWIHDLADFLFQAWADFPRLKIHVTSPNLRLDAIQCTFPPFCCKLENR